MKNLRSLFGILTAIIMITACTSATDGGAPPAEQGFTQQVGDLLHGEVMAVAYSGFRAGQHPDRGAGAKNPSRDEILEDLQILVDHDFKLIRMYDSKENTVTTLELIREHDLPIKVLLGIWLDAEFSNHEGCPWLDEPIPEDKLAANKIENAVEIERAIELANDYEDIVVAINVGNEAATHGITTLCDMATGGGSGYAEVEGYRQMFASGRMKSRIRAYLYSEVAEAWDKSGARFGEGDEKSGDTPLRAGSIRGARRVTIFLNRSGRPPVGG